MNRAINHERVDIEAIPDQFVTQELCDVAVRLSTHSIEYVPDKFKTEELCDYVTSHDSLAQYIEYIPTEFLTEEYILIGLISNFTDTAVRLKPAMLTDKMVDIIVKNEHEFPIIRGLGAYDKQFTSMTICDVLGKDRFTQEFCSEMVTKYPKFIRHVPESMVTKDMIIIALNKGVYPRNISITKDLLSDDDVISAIIDNHVKYNNAMSSTIALIPSDNISEQKWTNLVECYPYMLACMPNKYKTFDLCKLAIESNPNIVQYVPEDMLIENSVLWEIAIMDSLYVYSDIPKSIRDTEEFQEFVKNHIDECIAEVKSIL